MKHFSSASVLVLLFLNIGCVRQPSLPMDSKFNVTSRLNGTLWYGSGKVLRLKESPQSELSDRVNLLVFTDIDYPGRVDGPNPNTKNGCLDPDCTKTQALVIYNVPLKRGRYKISRLNRQAHRGSEQASLTYIGNAGGQVRKFDSANSNPGWIRVTGFDQKSGIVEGCFDVFFREDMAYYKSKGLEFTEQSEARFTDGLFRIKITDVLLR